MTSAPQKKVNRSGQIRPGYSAFRVVLPDDLIEEIRIEAVKRRVWPAVVAREMLLAAGHRSSDGPSAA